MEAAIPDSYFCCREQIEQCAERRTLHIAEAVAGVG